MSYDVWIEYPACAACGRDVSTVGEWNYTSNVSGMWDTAGAPLRDWDGRPVSACVELLAAAIDRMVADPATYRVMDAPNRWGTYDHLIPALRNLLTLFQSHSRGRVRVSL